MLLETQASRLPPDSTRICMDPWTVAGRMSDIGLLSWITITLEGGLRRHIHSFDSTGLINKQQHAHPFVRRQFSSML